MIEKQVYQVTLLPEILHIIISQGSNFVVTEISVLFGVECNEEAETRDERKKEQKRVGRKRVDIKNKNFCQKDY